MAKLKVGEEVWTAKGCGKIIALNKGHDKFLDRRVTWFLIRLPNRDDGTTRIRWMPDHKLRRNK